MTKNLESEITPEVIEKYRKALLEFKEPEEVELVTRPDIDIRQHPLTDIENYFEWVTRTGKPAIPWDVIRPAFLWKVKFVLDEMIRIEKAKLKEGEEIQLDKDTDFKLNFIKKKASEYEGPPFTFQRICELLITPSRHYKKLEKYIRALDKNINVVTVVTEMGIRITGADWPMPENSIEGKVEQRFFGKVDELDGLEGAGDFNKHPSEIATQASELATTLIGPMQPPVLTPPPEEPEPEQMEAIDMTNKPKDEPVKEEPEPMESDTSEPKAGDLPEVTATEVKPEEPIEVDVDPRDIPLPPSPEAPQQEIAMEMT